MDRLACPSCRQPYQMQSVSDPARLENNPNPKWDVPMDVIEWQCSYTQKVCNPCPSVHVCVCVSVHVVCSVPACLHLFCCSVISVSALCLCLFVFVAPFVYRGSCYGVFLL